ncbi:MAG: class I SAM-dependent methyltransferase [Methylococcales bacterium]
MPIVGRKSPENGGRKDANSLAGMAQREYGSPWPDYELLDAGDGKKLERWGQIISIRPDLQAHFPPEWPLAQWLKMAHWEYVEQSSTQGTWKALKADAPEHWTITYGPLTFHLKLTKFKHVGLFPEQQANWRFIKEHSDADQKILNLFAYTGAASLVASATGAEVVHVDSVKQLITWANENKTLSNLANIQWVLEDALKFALRELKRGNKYDGIIMDPPAWGLGAKGEKWKLENHLSSLLETAYGLMNPKAFLILNTYSPKVTLADLQKSGERFFSAKQMHTKQLWMKTKSGKELYYGNLLRAVK